MTPQQRYIVLPKSIITDKRLNATSLQILCVFLMFTDSDGYCFPSLRTIADITGLSESPVRRTIQSLIDYGYLVKQFRYSENGRQTSNGYFVSIHHNEAETGGGGCRQRQNDDNEKTATDTLPPKKSEEMSQKNKVEGVASDRGEGVATDGNALNHRNDDLSNYNDIFSTDTLPPKKSEEMSQKNKVEGVASDRGEGVASDRGEGVATDTPISIELNKERSNKESKKVSEIVNEQKTKNYAFEGKVIKLNQSDYEKWKNQFQYFASFDAELEDYDGYLHREGQTKDWFIRTHKVLRNRNQQLKKDLFEKTSSQPNKTMLANTGMGQREYITTSIYDDED
jgi:hypothetical protein